MSYSTTSGIPNVPDGLALWTDDDGCSSGCYIDIGLSDELVVSGTINQADFVLQMYGDACHGTNCYTNAPVVWDTESYYNGTDDTGGGDESYWFNAQLSGTADGRAATEHYMVWLQESALGAIRGSGVFNDLMPCEDGFPSGDPDNSAGCNPHENRYGYMSGQVRATMYDTNKDMKAELTLTFDVERKTNGFCQVLEGIGNALSVPPLNTGASTVLGVASYMVGIACM